MKYGKVIEGNLIIGKGCTDDFSKVEKITGGVYIRENATLQAEALTSIGGYVYISENATLQASLSLKKYDKDCPAKYTRQLALKFNFECFLKAGFLFADRILAKIIEKKKNVYKIQICGETKISYCIEIDGVFAHGDTLKQAKESLLYKISDRDTSKYNDYTLDTVITFEDAVKMYRCITGACEAGTRHFVENVLKNKKKKYTIREVIEETKGQYNNNVLAEFFNKKCEV